MNWKKKKITEIIFFILFQFSIRTGKMLSEAINEKIESYHQCMKLIIKFLSSFPLFLFIYHNLGSVRMPLQMSKCNHNTNSTYFSMNSFNNNNNNTNMTIQGGNDETNVTTSDNLLLASTTNSSQRWATTRNLNGNGQRTSLSWHVNRGNLSLNLNDNIKATNQNDSDDLTPVNTNNGQSPFDYQTRYRKTWIWIKLFVKFCGWIKIFYGF